MVRMPRTFVRLLLATVLVVVVAACGEQPPAGEQFDLTVTVTGTGTGTVTSLPAGIDVTTGDDPASFAFAEGTEVTLTAQAAAGSVFTGWSGACTGTATCTVTMDEDLAVTATFGPAVPTFFTLTVDLVGNGGGTVVSMPAGIDIDVGETTAEFAFLSGTVVTLAATAEPGSFFAGWTGACTGLGSCAVTMNADKTVTAEYALDSEVVTNSFSILAGSDDAEEYQRDTIFDDFPAGSVHVGSSDLDLNYDLLNDNGPTVVGLRYANVTIPRGAVIRGATITFTREGGTPPGVVTFTIEGHAADNAATFIQDLGESTFGISGRTRTTASAIWPSTTGWDVTAVSTDLSAVVQEVVSRGGWVSGNALAFIISSANSDAGNYRRAEAFEKVGGTPPQLSVTYYVPTAP